MVNDTLQRIEEAGVVAVLRGVEPDTVEQVAEAIVEGGVTALEVTADSHDAMDMIETLTETVGDDALVGVGTVLDSETTRAAIAAGAEFVVCPTFDRGVVETCNRYGVPVAPGVFTPTEAQQAYEAGADVVKVFPAKSGGPGHVSALKGPLGHLNVIPTGGVGPSNAGEYVEAGAMAVGAGGAILDHDAVDAGDYEQLTENAAALVRAVEDARN
ncbi:bifunctional 4-hydroxy-2-oxoglutarate aldolase/2-dehydro-3-deoxy-phosphogluconate aldolase [Salinarchaeum sp. Harcht-Bsk1]|uniref:bifunctional 4-hydroxy-2-oxoglutarate aldolase/2-dehydro-3-deoxy-phosphogluconate aldolase n=1 Tax=Salinarchaeum sp. Harcht-Bsk1 TaxID=1333523 RepID=UPI000677DC58|nr:bifunctional 4-hydroxy-2-oxoglutarate aldolase/2-dehydro-3-deoxy-phosphogluconate aldolase [Salinarchaeum sp. Harcht-Bsk1]